MALKATIFKVSLQVADMDRHHYADYQLTLARHPAETDQRLMVRLLAFALQADSSLEFCRGLCVDAEPALCRKSLGGDIELWIDVGLPDPERLRKACSRAGNVAVYCYGERAAGIWWRKHEVLLQRHDNLSVFCITDSASHGLTDLAKRSMHLHANIQDGLVSFGDRHAQLQIEPLVYLRGGEG